mmetsp:Transcript_7936/g.15388  ORF Transcript_7936/g.15388 Transcript_7936/m.15388 type:complete len:288 (-) Transcript_7936:73-936(-)
MVSRVTANACATSAHTATSARTSALVARTTYATEGATAIGATAATARASATPAGGAKRVPALARDLSWSLTSASTPFATPMACVMTAGLALATAPATMGTKDLIAEFSAQAQQECPAMSTVSAATMGPLALVMLTTGGWTAVTGALKPQTGPAMPHMGSATMAIPEMVRALASKTAGGALSARSSAQVAGTTHALGTEFATTAGWAPGTAIVIQAGLARLATSSALLMPRIHAMTTASVTMGLLVLESVTAITTSRMASGSVALAMTVSQLKPRISNWRAWMASTTR